MPPKVKICGITRLEDALAACKMGAWALGFNFYQQSPRYITVEEAAAIIKKLPKNVEKVGVFVNAPKNYIEKTARAAGITMIQLHGNESPDLASHLKGWKVIKAFRLLKPEDIWPIKDFSNIKYILTDSGTNQVFGGSGQVADWNLSKVAKDFGQVILAGGIKPENVLEAYAKVRPFAFDVASGVESSPGVKDHEKMKKLFDSVASCED